jgi:hypothetical protein
MSDPGNLVVWVEGQPKDAAEWETIASRCADGLDGKALRAVRIRKTPDGRWWIEGARKGVEPGSPPSPALDFRRRLTEALNENKAVLGLEALGEPLTPEREQAVRSSVRAALGGSDPHANATLFDVQVVSDLLAEVDRLRAKLQLAAHARDLTGQAASALRDASEDITPRPTRSFGRGTPRR